MAKKDCENEDRSVETRWIYDNLRAQGHLTDYDDRLCKEKVFRVLSMLHKEHLEIMYIYYYRKKLYSDVLSLKTLWKIQELDEEWSGFRDQYSKIKQEFDAVLSSIQEIPKDLSNMLENCSDIRILRYFR